MSEQLKHLFDELLIRLREARDTDSREIANELYSSIISEVEAMYAVDDASFADAFQLLSRHVSEYLPHTEKVLAVWNRIKKLARGVQNEAR